VIRDIGKRALKFLQISTASPCSRRLFISGMPSPQSDRLHAAESQAEIAGSPSALDKPGNVQGCRASRTGRPQVAGARPKAPTISSHHTAWPGRRPGRYVLPVDSITPPSPLLASSNCPPNLNQRLVKRTGARLFNAACLFHLQPAAPRTSARQLHFAAIVKVSIFSLVIDSAVCTRCRHVVMPESSFVHCR